MHRLQLSVFTVILLSLSASQTGCVAHQADEDDSDQLGPEGKPDDSRWVNDAAIFSGTGPSTLRIEAPFAPAFSAARAGEPDGFFPQPRVKEPFAGTMIYKQGRKEIRIPIELTVRGNSSLQECAFPKLKVKAAKPAVAGTVFEGVHKFKIGTHCGEGGSGTIGRLRNQTAAWREALVYRIAAAAALPTLAVRPLTITYVDTAAANATVTRKAFLLEHIELAAKRYGGEALEDPEQWQGDPQAEMGADVIAQIHLLQALVGNWDWDIGAPGAGRVLWNTEAVKSPGGMLPIAADFDLASMVTRDWLKAETLDVLPAERDVHVRQAAHYLATGAGASLPIAALLRARDHFVAKRAAIEAAAASGPIDATGRKNAQEHVRVFYLALAQLEAVLAAQPQ